MNNDARDAPAPATLLLATCNRLNLANPGRLFYDSQDLYSAQEYARKIDWLDAQTRRLNADAIASRLTLHELTSNHAFTAAQMVVVSDHGKHKAFERWIVEALIEVPGGRGTMRVLVAHFQKRAVAASQAIAYDRSKEFVASSRFTMGEVRRVEYCSDHLHEGRDRVRSDDGFVRAQVLLR